MRTLTVTICAVAALVVAGCSSHDEKFEDRVPPPPVKSASAEELAASAATIVLRFRGDVDRLPADALAPLTQASALAFRASGAPGLRAVTRQYADGLLRARLPTSRARAFYGRERPDSADAAITARAVDALVDAFLATHEPRYRRAAASGAAALTSPSLGLRRARGGAVFRDPPRRGNRRSVALSAEVARALRRASDPLIGARTAAVADDLLGGVVRAQEGLGRWYAFLGTRTPMTLEQWSTTLLAVATSPAKGPAGGVAGAGIPALFGTGFSQQGAPNPQALPDPSGRGAPLAISAFDAFPAEPKYALLVTQRTLERLRKDGTVDSAGARNAELQALYATGLARRSLSSR